MRLCAHTHTPLAPSRDHMHTRTNAHTQLFLHSAFDVSFPVTHYRNSDDTYDKPIKGMDSERVLVIPLTSEGGRRSPGTYGESGAGLGRVRGFLVNNA